jgi:hypothetical protein
MIKNLTDPESLLPRLPRLGKLRKGGEKTSKGYGPDLDHFRFTSDNPEALAAWNAAFPKPPRELTIYLPYETAAENFTTWVELWSSSGLEHRCDGEMMTIWRDGDKMVKGQRPCTGGHEKGDPRRDAVGRLEFVVPQLLQAGYVGTVVMETHSINDIVFIAGVLAGLERKHARLSGVAFRLYRQQEKISVPGWGDRQGQRQRTDKWLVKIEPDAAFMRREIALARAAALDLPAPEVVDATTGEYVLAEPAPMPALPAPRQSAQPAQPVRADSIREPAKPLSNSHKAAAQTQPTASNGNGNGKKLASLEKLKERWNTLWQWKIALGIKADAIPQGAASEQYIAAGRALHAALVTRAKEILPADFGWPDNDDTIEAAVNTLANLKDEAAAVTLEAA